MTEELQAALLPLIEQDLKLQAEIELKELDRKALKVEIEALLLSHGETKCKHPNGAMALIINGCNKIFKPEKAIAAGVDPNLIPSFYEEKRFTSVQVRKPPKEKDDSGDE